MRYRSPVARKRTDATGSAHDRGESTTEVLDRNVDELLQEVRVTITGVQVLFAFLLTLPFQQRFSALDTFGTTIYSVAMASSACATVLLVAPVSMHRMLFRQHEKDVVVRFADRALLHGLGLLLVGIVSAVLLVLDVGLGRGPAVTGCAVVGLVALTTWYLLPVGARRRSR